MEFKKIIDSIVKEKAKSVVNGDKIEGGHNGPYYDDELPIRNISHWICTFSKYYELTNNKLYYNAVDILSKEFLKLDDDKSCMCRKKEGKDKTNGVIGQAWVIEGLLASAKTLNNNIFYEKSIKLFNIQEFNKKDGLWSVVEINGKNLGYDITFNHQLWFAAAGCQIIDYKYNEEIDKKIKIFLKKAENFFLVHNDGLIYHYLKYINNLRSLRWHLRTFYHTEVANRKKLPSLVYKEKGYHLFSVFAFAILYDRYKDENFFKLEKVKKSIQYSFNEEFLNELSDTDSNLDSTKISMKSNQKINAYAFPYNSPAFEIPYIAKVFKPEFSREVIEKLFEKQIELTYNNEQNVFSKNTEDKETLTARIYEYVKSM